MKFKAYKYKSYRSNCGEYEVIYDRSVAGWTSWRKVNEKLYRLVDIPTMATAEGGFAACARDRKRRKEEAKDNGKSTKEETLHGKLFKFGPG